MQKKENKINVSARIIINNFYGRGRKRQDYDKNIGKT